METNPSSPPKEMESVLDETVFLNQGYDKHIRQARNVIFIAAGLLLINVVFMGVNSSGNEFLWLDIVIWSIFIIALVLLGFYTKKKPYTAILAALAVYTLFIVLNAFLDINTIWKGLIFKIIVYVSLFKAINDAKEAQNLQEHLEKA